MQLALGRECGRSGVKLLEVSASINCKDEKGLFFVYNNLKAAEYCTANRGADFKVIRHSLV